MASHEGNISGIGVKELNSKSKLPPGCVTHVLCVLSLFGVSDSLQSPRLWPSRLPCPWNSPGKNTGVGYYAFLQGILPTQGSNLGLMCLLYYRQILYH